jgi:peptide deformylase
MQGYDGVISVARLTNSTTIASPSFPTMLISHRTITVFLLVVCVILESAQAWIGSKATGRRLLFQKTLGSFLAIGTTKAIFRRHQQQQEQEQPASFTPPLTVPTTSDSTDASLVYSDEWTGTALSLVTVQESAAASTREYWPMAQWPDPILRHVAAPVEQELFGTAALQTACRRLERTAIREKAVGLAAQQCGVNARIVYLERSNQNTGPWHLPFSSPSSSLATLTMINPNIVQRSPETEMRVWTEQCLVLPPTLQVTLLRDAWVDVEYQNVAGEWCKERLEGEVARAAQHELDHDRGILMTDHVSLDELENDLMRSIEQQGHDQRMVLAYARTVEDSVAPTVMDRTGYVCLAE